MGIHCIHRLQNMQVQEIQENYFKNERGQFHLIMEQFPDNFLVKLYHCGAWRRVFIDDRFPLDIQGNSIYLFIHHQNKSNVQTPKQYLQSSSGQVKSQNLKLSVGPHDYKNSYTIERIKTCFERVNI